MQSLPQLHPLHPQLLAKIADVPLHLGKYLLPTHDRRIIVHVIGISFPLFFFFFIIVQLFLDFATNLAAVNQCTDEEDAHPLWALVNHRRHLLLRIIIICSQQGSFMSFHHLTIVGLNRFSCESR